MDYFFNRFVEYVQLKSGKCAKSQSLESRGQSEAKRDLNLTRKMKIRLIDLESEWFCEDLKMQLEFVHEFDRNVSKLFKENENYWLHLKFVYPIHLSFQGSIAAVNGNRSFTNFSNNSNKILTLNLNPLLKFYFKNVWNWFNSCSSVHIF